MYATIILCDLHNRTSTLTHGHSGRTLASALAALPGFVAFVALDMDAGVGSVATLCLMEERAGLAEAERVIAQWQAEQNTTTGSGVRRVGAGEVIAQWGL
jgi:hypothetical protein